MRESERANRSQGHTFLDKEFQKVVREAETGRRPARQAGKSADPAGPPRAELKTDLAQTKVAIIKWMAGMLVIQLGLFGTLIKLVVG